MSAVLRHGQAFSPIYRFSLSDGTMVSAHTKSKLMRSPGTNEPQLYMSLHILQRYVSPYTIKNRLIQRADRFDVVFVGLFYWQQYLQEQCFFVEAVCYIDDKGSSFYSNVRLCQNCMTVFLWYIVVHISGYR